MREVDLVEMECCYLEPMPDGASPFLFTWLDMNSRGKRFFFIRESKDGSRAVALFSSRVKHLLKYKILRMGSSHKSSVCHKTCLALYKLWFDYKVQWELSVWPTGTY